MPVDPEALGWHYKEYLSTKKFGRTLWLPCQQSLVFISYIFFYHIFISYTLYFSRTTLKKQSLGWWEEKLGQLANRNLMLSALHPSSWDPAPNTHEWTKVKSQSGEPTGSVTWQWHTAANELMFPWWRMKLRGEREHTGGERGLFSGSLFTESQSVKRQFTKNITSTRICWKPTHQRSTDGFQENCQANILNQILDVLLLLFPSKGKQAWLKDRSRGQGQGYCRADI